MCAKIFTTLKRSLRRLCFYTCLSFCSQRGCTPRGQSTSGQTPPAPSTKQTPSLGRYPPGKPPPTPSPRPPPPKWALRDRYASYWNAFLFKSKFYVFYVFSPQKIFSVFDRLYLTMGQCCKPTCDKPSIDIINLEELVFSFVKRCLFERQDRLRFGWTTYLEVLSIWFIIGHFKFFP